MMWLFAILLTVVGVGVETGVIPNPMEHKKAIGQQQTLTNDPIIQVVQVKELEAGLEDTEVGRLTSVPSSTFTLSATDTIQVEDLNKPGLCVVDKYGDKTGQCIPVPPKDRRMVAVFDYSNAFDAATNNNPLGGGKTRMAPHDLFTSGKSWTDVPGEKWSCIQSKEAYSAPSICMPTRLTYDTPQENGMVYVAIFPDMLSAMDKNKIISWKRIKDSEFNPNKLTFNDKLPPAVACLANSEHGEVSGTCVQAIYAGIHVAMKK